MSKRINKHWSEHLTKANLVENVKALEKKDIQAEINKKSAKTRHENTLSRTNKARSQGYKLADVMCDIIINNEPDWDNIVGGYDSLNYEYVDIKETIEYIYGDSVPVDLPEPCSKHKYYHPDNCYECEEEEEDEKQ